MQPGESSSTLKVRILLTCGTFAIIFTVLCLLAVCLAKCCRSSSAESSDQETINNDARNRPTAAKNREQVVEEVLTTFPAYTYGVDKSPPPQQWKSCSDGAVCSICLGEYQKGECLRLLPKCGHVFHKGCIDLWLSTRSSSCPICRDKAVAVTNMDLSSGDDGVRGRERIPIPSWSISFGTGNVL
ncbi:Putative RING-H2 finger protein ATL12 [Linum perenne]